MLPCVGLFSFIGADPATGWLSDCAALDERAHEPLTEHRVRRTAARSDERDEIVRARPVPPLQAATRRQRDALVALEAGLDDEARS